MVGSIYFLFYGVFELIKGISGSNVDNKYRRPSPGIEHSGVWTSLVLKPKFYFLHNLIDVIWWPFLSMLNDMQNVVPF